MAPQRFASARVKSRPSPRAPFRDDTSLVALRYEQTVQARPPIPIIPLRNPARTAGRPFSSAPSSPVVIVPPAVPPALEQHPALRSARPVADEWKRDSGLAPTTSTVTIPEEDEDEDDNDDADSAAARQSELGAADPPDDPWFAIGSRAETPQLQLQLTEFGPRCNAGSASPRPEPPSPTTLAREASRRLVRSFSFRSNPSTTWRPRKTSSDGQDDSSARGVCASPKSPKRKMSEPGSRAASPTASADLDFAPIDTNIPTESLIDDDTLTSLTFSKRGSLMFGGKRAFGLAPSSMEKPPNRDGALSNNDVPGPADGAAAPPEPATTTTPPPAVAAARPLPVPSIRVISLDVEQESQKVRSLYESGDDISWEDGDGEHAASPSEGRALAEEAPSDEEEKIASPSSDGHLSPDPASFRTPRSASSLSHRRDRTAFERAGGLEDWEDVDGADVDRYGFISVRRPQSARASTPDSQLLTPRRRNVLVKSHDSTYASSPLGPGRTPSRKVSARSLNTQTSDMSTVSRRSARSSIRAAANMLPHNRDRKCMDEAGDMLTLAPGLADIAEDEQVEKMSDALKKKEWERSEKWRKMAKVVKKGKDGQGMEFEFDVKSAKLTERTWKGIPDRWRAAAWYSFLATSAKREGSTVTDDDMIAEFHRSQSVSSPDDVQIDLDVPRTINRHIMFRKRYRGGQRLLFRVLHALSLYFPDTGYVQGMASLAATLLCYYDEEKCFVMLVRMWQLRGLERLYQPGFGYLMAALRDLEKHWLAGKDVARKLHELNIDPTAYGTRWYLTLFNLSVPFPAQLRIWDVFMLLGEAPPPEPDPADAAAAAADTPAHGLDVLHAASAALIHALRDVLLDSDFENAMKALTSWVPVKDEELLMKVTRAEWKLRQGKARRTAA